MAWKGVHLSSPARLSLADHQIVVAKTEGSVRIALEDIGWVIIDHPQVTLTSALLSACMTHGVAVIVTDERHTPTGVTLPFHTHHRQGGIAADQMSLGGPLKKRLWQAIVRSKIEVQADVLASKATGHDSVLRAMAQLVRSGDPHNIEARAAREYWARLFRDFVRDDEGDRRNKLLNYGYAVVRSAVARSLVAAGFIPSIGLHHASQTNAFNLADDLVEPSRPFVDALTFSRTGERRPEENELTLEDRRAMAGVLLAEARLGRETMTVLAAVETTVHALGRVVSTKQAIHLLLPRFPLQTEAQG